MAERGVGGRFKRKRPCRSREPERAGSAAGRVRRRRRNSDNLAALEAFGVAAGFATAVGGANSTAVRAQRLPQPRDARDEVSKGERLHREGDLAGAEQCMRNAARLDVGCDDAHNYLGLFLAARGELDRAEECYRKAVSARMGKPAEPVQARHQVTMGYEARCSPGLTWILLPGRGCLPVSQPLLGQFALPPLVA